jgi:hypothetical protein
MDKAKAKEIFSDAVFVTSLLKLETAEEAQKALEARGLEVSLEEIKAIGDVLEKDAENGGKLSEADMGNVAGGQSPAERLHLRLKQIDADRPGRELRDHREKNMQRAIDFIIENYC